MEQTNPGQYGAKVQSWRSANPRNLLKRLRDEAPASERGELLKEFMAEVRREENEDFLLSIIEYWFANNFDSLTFSPAVPVSKINERAKVTRDLVEATKSVIVKRAAVVLLDLEMPNGKALRDCTGAECAKLGGKVGAWLGAIAKKVKPAETVGSVLSESEVRKLWK